MSNFKRTWSFIILLFASSFLIPFSSCGSKAEDGEGSNATIVDDNEHPTNENDAEHPSGDEEEHPTNNNDAEHPNNND